MAAARKKPGMSASHKAALANGRAEGKIIREYLDAVEANRPKRGRKRTPESISRRLNVITKELAIADSVTKVRLVQERLDLQRELKMMKTKVDLLSIEKKFLRVAKRFSERNNITFDAWREVGVTPEVLKRAGIERD
jgi:hypothetical protein